ncbi:MAG: TlpA disulfide reductase family protein [Pseudomonadota bacterium]
MIRLFLLACFATLLTSCSAPSDSAGSASLQDLARASLKKMEIFAEPKPLPDVPVTLGTDETPATLTALASGARLINLWATWCAPCVKELPALDRLAAQENDDGFEIIAISIDRGRTDTIASFLAKNEINNLPLVRDKAAALPQAMGLGVLPVTFVVSGEGKIIGQLLGEADWDSPEAKAFVDKLQETSAAS